MFFYLIKYLAYPECYIVGFECSDVIHSMSSIVPVYLKKLLLADVKLRKKNL